MTSHLRLLEAVCVFLLSCDIACGYIGNDNFGDYPYYPPDAGLTEVLSKPEVKRYQSGSNVTLECISTSCRANKNRISWEFKDYLGSVFQVSQLKKQLITNMLTTFVLAVFYLFLGINSQSQQEVEYYVNLIQTETKKSLEYKLPTDASEYKTDSDHVIDFGKFDFVVIGAGAGGSVIANRLSEIKDWNVLVLEAGDWGNNFTDIPGMFNYFSGTKYNWNMETIPQKSACLDLKNQQCLYPRGKGLGGSTLINAGTYTRGNRADFDQWEEDGSPGWSYNKILRYFIKSENTTVDNADPGYHGYNAYLRSEYRIPVDEILKLYIKGNAELGRKELDYNGREQLGVGRIQYNTVNGRRQSHGTAFLKPILRRKNLKLSSNSFVTKILIDERRKSAIGVEFNKNGNKYRVSADKEVIVSAGTLLTPQILMLSGIGPKKDLEKLKIKPVSDLPVGQNLHDHISFPELKVSSNFSEASKTMREKVIEFLRGEGDYTVPSHGQGLGFFQTKLAYDKGQPDLETVVLTSSDNETVADSANSSGPTIFTLLLVCLNPESVGSVTLKSNSPYEYPIINANFFSDKEDHDIEVLYQGILMTKEMLKTSALKSINSEVQNPNHTACKGLKVDTKEYWYCLIRQLSLNFHHPMGTAKMGPRSKGGVVDSMLKVYGIENLRVCDGSVIPTTLSAHPVAAVTMIAEKLGDMIKEDYNCI